MNHSDWRPTATLTALQRRAALLARSREFFAERGVLEVQTPALVQTAVTDPQIESFAVLEGSGARRRYLHTSPEYAMKRLLAAGSGDIYQICQVFRAGESGSPVHNAEFTLLEWYRLGFSLQQLMRETAALATMLLDPAGSPRPVEYVTYAEAFRRALRLDPLECSLEALTAAAARHGLARSSLTSASRDDLLDFLVASQVGPRLGLAGITCLHNYPASQASLAQLDNTDPRTARRFELYVQGIEIANGYVELADATEQAARFEADARERERRGLVVHGGDRRLLAALQHGLPPCAGVALGFDRLVMVALGAKRLDAVLTLPADRA
ncbi:MAG: EF-P lysine aminoacylase EpmA [Pseudomonadota bacterium]